MKDWKRTLLTTAVLLVSSQLTRGQSATADAPGSMPAATSASAAPEASTRADRAYLGVALEEAGSDWEGGGVKLAEVMEGTAAAKAGLKAGDVIVALDEQTIGGADALAESIQAMKVGQKVKITFLRDGEKRRTSAKLGSMPVEGETQSVEVGAGGRESAEVSVLKPVVVRSGGRARAVELVEPPKTEQHEAGHDAAGGMAAPSGGFLGVQLAVGDEGEVTVTEVVAGSPAEAAGMQAGDVITMLDGKELESVEALVAAVQSHKAGDRVTVSVVRGDATKKIKAVLGSRADAPMAGGAAAPAPEPPATMRAARTARAAAEAGRAAAAEGRVAAERGRAAAEAAAETARAGDATQLRSRVARPGTAGPDAPGGRAAEMDAFRKELEGLRAQLNEAREQAERARAEVEQMRARFERQSRTLDAIRRALSGGGNDESESPQAMSALLPAPGGSAGGMVTFAGTAHPGGPGGFPMLTLTAPTMTGTATGTAAGTEEAACPAMGTTVTVLGGGEAATGECCAVGVTAAAECCEAEVAAECCAGEGAIVLADGVKLDFAGVAGMPGMVVAGDGEETGTFVLKVAGEPHVIDFTPAKGEKAQAFTFTLDGEQGKVMAVKAGKAEKAAKAEKAVKAEKAPKARAVKVKAAKKSPAIQIKKAGKNGGHHEVIVEAKAGKGGGYHEVVVETADDKCSECGQVKGRPAFSFQKMRGLGGEAHGAWVTPQRPQMQFVAPRGGTWRTVTGFGGGGSFAVECEGACAVHCGHADMSKAHAFQWIEEEACCGEDCEEECCAGDEECCAEDADDDEDDEDDEDEDDDDDDDDDDDEDEDEDEDEDDDDDDINV